MYNYDPKLCWFTISIPATSLNERKKCAVLLDTRAKTYSIHEGI